jgi:recombination associated protein RdgC
MAFPKSLRYYQAPTKDQNPRHLNEAMQNYQFTPCGAMDWFTQGFVPPVPGQEHLAYHMHGTILVALRRQEKRIPASAIRDRVQEIVQEIEARDVRRVGRKEKQQLRERVTDELLPSTQPTSWTIRAWIDLARNRVMVEASSAAKAELMITMLRTAMPPYPARLPRPLLSPAMQMTAWLQGEAPPGFTLDADCELKAPGEGGAVVRCTRQDLTASEVRAHLDGGKQVSKLGLTFDDSVSFVLTDDFGLRKIKFHDVLAEKVDGENAEDVFFSEQSVITLELAKLLDALEEAHGGVEPAEALF